MHGGFKRGHTACCHIKKRRTELNLSQQELAKAIGYKSRSTIAKIEAGENSIPKNKLPKFEKKEIHHFVICDGCKMAPIIGKRYKCKECKDFDFCEKCYEKNKLTHGHGHEFNHIEKPQFHNPFLLLLNFYLLL